MLEGLGRSVTLNDIYSLVIQELTDIEELSGQYTQQQIKHNLTSFLSHKVRMGWATVDKSGGVGHYKYTPLIERHPPTPAYMFGSDVGYEFKQQPKSPTGEVDAIQIGNSVIALISSLKRKCAELTAENKEFVEEVKHLNDMLTKSKEKILKLNEQINSGVRRINLHDLQNICKGGGA